jgi:hypothetical protein
MTDTTEPIAVITGGRDYTPTADELAEFDGVIAAAGITRVHVGDADGTDKRIRDHLRDHHPAIVVRVFRVRDWSIGPHAGNLRNAEMFDGFAVRVCVSFRGRTGTADCTDRARALGVGVIEIDERQSSLFGGGT